MSHSPTMHSFKGRIFQITHLPNPCHPRLRFTKPYVQLLPRAMNQRICINQDTHSPPRALFTSAVHLILRATELVHNLPNNLDPLMVPAHTIFGYNIPFVSEASDKLACTSRTRLYRYCTCRKGFVAFSLPLSWEAFA